MSSAKRGHSGGFVKVPRAKRGPMEKLEPMESGLTIVKMDPSGKWRFIEDSGLQIVQIVIRSND